MMDSYEHLLERRAAARRRRRTLRRVRFLGFLALIVLVVFAATNLARAGAGTAPRTQDKETSATASAEQTLLQAASAAKPQAHQASQRKATSGEPRDSTAPVRRGSEQSASASGSARTAGDSGPTAVAASRDVPAALPLTGDDHLMVLLAVGSLLGVIGMLLQAAVQPIPARTTRG